MNRTCRRQTVRLLGIFDIDWTLCRYVNLSAFEHQAQQIHHLVPHLTPQDVQNWNMHIVEVLMGNKFGADARKEQEARIHDVFRTHFELKNGFMPPAAQWSYVARAILLLKEHGVQITPEILDLLVDVEHEMFDLVGKENGLYPDAASTIAHIRREHGAEIVALTTDDIRLQKQPGGPPLYCTDYSRDMKMRRLGAQGLFEVIPPSHVIVATHGKHDPKTWEEVLTFAATTETNTPLMTFKVGDVHSDMKIPATIRIFLVRQLKSDGTFDVPDNANHVIHQLAELPVLLDEYVA